MQYNPPSYYSPYESEEEVNAQESEYDTGSGSDTSDDTIARHLDDPRYAIVRAAGPSMQLSGDQFAYERTNIGSQYAQTPSTLYTSSPLYVDNVKKVQTSLLSIRSKDRDQNVYPTSSYFTLKTPRVYKNVTQVQCVQISFPYYQNAITDPTQFSSTIIDYLETIDPSFASTISSLSSSCACCFNTNTSLSGMSFIEQGRCNPVQPSAPLINSLSVSPGGYNASDIVDELNRQNNKTPPFNMISYKDHRTQFNATKNISHLFNEGGLFLYNTLTKTFKARPSKDDIIANYYPLSHKQYGSAPTEKETFVAYYYPVLKEAVANGKDALYLDYLTYSEKDVLERVLGHFEGLTSDMYYGLCSTNRVYLERLRRKHTFEYYPVNQYDWSYDGKLDRINVSVNSLHPSLRTEVETHRRNTLYQSIDEAGLTYTQYINLQTLNNKLGGVVIDLHALMNSNLALTMGVSYGVYSASTLVSPGAVLSTMVPSLLPVSQRSDTEAQLAALALGTISAPVFSPPYTRPSPSTFSWTMMSDLLYDANTYTSHPGDYNMFYIDSLSTLNSYSAVSRRFGAGYVDGYSGVQITTTNYSTLYSTFLSYQSTYSSQLQSLSTIIANSHTYLYNTVSSKYSTVFPSAYLSNSAFVSGAPTGPVIYDMKSHTHTNSTPFDDVCISSPCCAAINSFLETYYSCLPVNYVINSLPYKLGFTAAELLVYLSTQSAFGPFPNNNLYLTLNTSQSFNTMDVIAEPENFTVTNETVGQSKVVLGKILMTGQDFLGVSQTIIQSPARFSPSLGKLDKLELSILLDDQLTPLSLVFPFGFPFTDWDAVFQIDEEVSAFGDKDLTTAPSVQWDKSKTPF